MILEVTGMKIGKEKFKKNQVVRELADDDLNQAAGGSVMQQNKTIPAMNCWHKAGAEN